MPRPGGTVPRCRHPGLLSQFPIPAFLPFSCCAGEMPPLLQLALSCLLPPVLTRRGRRSFYTQLAGSPCWTPERSGAGPSARSQVPSVACLLVACARPASFSPPPLQMDFGIAALVHSKLGKGQNTQGNRDMAVLLLATT